jgi:hypothetical protein
MIKLNRDDWYKEHRMSGSRIPAFSWNSIVWEATRAIGEQDVQIWLNNMKDILEHDNFVKNPQTKDTATKLYKQKPFLKYNVWVCPHPKAHHKLGYYLVWAGGNQEPREVFGEIEVRKVLGLNTFIVKDEKVLSNPIKII